MLIVSRSVNTCGGNLECVKQNRNICSVYTCTARNARSVPFGSVQIQMGKFVSETTAARIASAQRINWAMMHLETLILRHEQTPSHVRRKTEQDT